MATARDRFRALSRIFDDTSVNAAVDMRYNTFMTVYAEVLILESYLSEAAALFVTARLCALATSKKRILLAALIGAAVAACVPLFFRLKVIVVAVKLLAAMLMIALTAKRFTRKKYILAVAVYFVLTLTGGGAARCLKLLFPKLPISGGAVTAAISLVFLGIFARVRSGKHRERFTAQLRVSIMGSEFECPAFLDSGNSLVDPLSGLPIVIVERRLMEPYLRDGGGRVVTYNTLAGEGRMTVIKPDKIEIYFGGQPNIIFDVMLGVDMLPGKLNGALLSPLLLS